MFDQFLNNGQSNNAERTDPLLSLPRPWMPAAVRRVVREGKKKKRKKEREEEEEKEVKADYKAVLN